MNKVFSDLPDELQQQLREMEQFEEQFSAKFAVDESSGMLLHNLVLQEQPNHILELGTWRGASALYMASAFASKNQHITTIDRVSVRSPLAEKNIEAFAYKDQITCLYIDIQDYLDRFDSKDQPQFDFVFFDAAKKKQGKWLRQMHQLGVMEDGALLVFDDVVTMRDKMDDLFDAFNELQDHLADYKQYKIDDGLITYRYKKA